MPEIPTIHPNEQRLPPDGVSAAESVFTGVYGAFVEDARNAPTDRKQLIDGHVVTVTVDPALEFVQKRFEEAAKSVAPLASQPTRPTTIHDRFTQEATAEAKSIYAHSPAMIATRAERANRLVSGFISRASEMFEKGETDGLTVKLFFDRIQGLKYGLSANYNSLVTRGGESMPGKDAQDRYATAVRGIFAGQDDVQEQKSGPFLHVNADHYLASDSHTVERYYISPKLNGRPEEVVKTWVETLDSLGLGDKLYYKVAEGLSRRYDGLIAYASTDTAEDMEKAVQEFVRRCQPDLLSDTAIPTGAKVAKGIARAPEPDEINTLLRYRGRETLSYSEFACSLTELALRRASYDFMKQGMQANNVTPKALSEAAKTYFVQFVKLSGIDPTTMRAVSASVSIS